MKKQSLFVLLCAACFSLQAQTFNYLGPVQPAIIPDNNVVISFPVTVSGLPSQIDASFGLNQVCLTVIHPQSSDLKITLRSPDGSSTNLTVHNGSSSNYMNTCFEMSAASRLMFSTNPFTGAFLPDQSLNVLNNGQDPNGTWYIDVLDEFPFTSGTFNDASITFTNNPSPDPLLLPGVCDITNASGCVCRDTSLNNCDLLPDIICSYVVIRDGWNESPGLIDMPNAVIDIGSGPLEMKPTGQCYCDTVNVSCSLVTCPNGNPPKERVDQRIYHKNSNGTMTYTDSPAGYQTFHPNHNHIHAEDFGMFSLRVATSNPDAMTWPIIGDSVKQGYCMINMGTCISQDSICMSHGQVIVNSMIPNLGLGTVTGCGSTGQGIFVGNYDIYSSGFGQYIQVPNLCNGDYFIVTMMDPYNNFQEEDETNNWVAVPVHLTQQSGPSLNASFTYTNNGYNYAFLNFTNGVTRFWDFGDGSTITAPFPQHTYAGPGTYTVLLTVFNGTCATTSAQIIVVQPVGITSQQSGVFDFSASPNPSKDNFSVEYQMVNPSAVSIEVMNMLGEKVQSVADEYQLAGKHVYDVSGLNAGTYFIRLQANDQVMVKKIVKI